MYTKIIETVIKLDIDSFISEYNNLNNPINNSELFKEINYSVKLIDSMRNKGTEKKEKFVQEVIGFLKINGVAVDQWEGISFIQNAYDKLFENRRRIGKEYTSSELIKALFYYMNMEYYCLLSNVNSIDNLESIETRLEDLMKLFFMNIRFECHLNNWFDRKSKIAVLPADILSYEENYSLNNTQKEKYKELITNTGFFDIFEEFDYQFRLLKKKLVLAKNSIKVENTDKELEDYALIARTRYQRYLLSLMQEQPVITKDNKNEFNLQKKIFLDFLHIDVTSDTEYGGLTLSEWINGIFILRRMVKEHHDFYFINNEYLEHELSGYFSSTEKVIKFINYMSYNKESEDFYDTPILRFSNQFSLLVPFGLLEPNFLKIISSIFSQYEIEVKPKGKNFEKSTENLLKKYEQKFKYKSYPISKKIRDRDYQIDVLIEWGDFIFIIECKNRSIPSTIPRSLGTFIQNVKNTKTVNSKKVECYVDQMHRLKNIIETDAKEFGISDIEKKTVIPVILNALPFSLDYQIDGIFFCDFFILKRFLEERYLSKIIIDKNKKKYKKEPIKDQWSQRVPNEKNFLDYISAPYQVTSEKERITSEEITNDYLGISATITKKRLLLEEIEHLINQVKRSKNSRRR